MSTTNATVQLSDIWRTRPLRLPDQGPGAGVAAGIGFRYGVDPVLVRVAFVVSTVFGGAGLLLYLLGWFAFTRVGDQVSPAESMMGHGQSSLSSTGRTWLLIALLVAVAGSGPVGLGTGGSGLVSMGLMLAGWYLLHRRTPEPPTIAAGPATTTLASVPPTWSPYTTLPERYTPDTPTVDLTKSSSQHAPEPARPPAWDPLGVAPFAWDLPSPPSPAPVPPPASPRNSSRLTTTVIGLAIIAAAVAAMIGHKTGSSFFDPTRIAAIALTVVGVGLLIGAFLRRGYGLLVVAAPLAGFVVVSSPIIVSDPPSRSFGNVEATPTVLTERVTPYSAGLGNIDLDLRGLELDDDRWITLDLFAGNVDITLPPDLDVIAHCTADLGNVTCPNEGGVDGGSDGMNGGPVLTIDARTSLGNVEVSRG